MCEAAPVKIFTGLQLPRYSLDTTVHKVEAPPSKVGAQYPKDSCPHEEALRSPAKSRSNTLKSLTRSLARPISHKS